jgi:type II secretory pathway component GspD/PulD (secretin)
MSQGGVDDLDKATSLGAAQARRSTIGAAPGRGSPLHSGGRKMKLSCISLAILCSLPTFSIASDSESKQGALVPSVPNSRDTDLRALLREAGQDCTRILCWIRGRHRPAQLVPILRPMMPQYGHMAALVDRNALILVDRTANVRRLVELIRILENLPKVVDVPAPKTS